MSKEDEKVKIDIKLDYQVTIHTNLDVKKKYDVWLGIHDYGPYTLRLIPTGIHTGIMLKHTESGHEIDLTDYEVI